MGRRSIPPARDFPYSDTETGPIILSYQVIDGEIVQIGSVMPPVIALSSAMILLS